MTNVNDYFAAFSTAFATLALSAMVGHQLVIGLLPPLL
jgi:hypothetical protein